MTTEPTTPQARMIADGFAQSCGLIAQLDIHNCGYYGNAPTLMFPEPDDYAQLLRDPSQGLRGLEFFDPSKVLKIWADDLLTVEHAGKWRFMFDAAEPFPGDWLTLVASTDYVLVAATPGVLPAGKVSGRELSNMPAALFRVDDRRR